MRSPSFSVIVPAYNAARTIESTLASVLRQSTPDLELIVIDDGSEDETAALIERCRVDPRVKLIRQENSGAAVARNTGLEVARGSIVAFLDADDLWLPDYLVGASDALRAHPEAGFAHADAYLYDELLGKIRRKTSFEHYEPIPEFIPAPALLRRLIHENFVLSTVAVRSEVLDEVGGFDPALNATEDWDLWLRIAAAGFGSTHPAGPRIVQRDQPDSVSKDEMRAFRTGELTLAKLLGTESLDEDVAALVREQMAMRRARADQIQHNAPIERARRVRRRILAMRERRGDTWLEEPPAVVAAAMPQLVASYGEPLSTRGESGPRSSPQSSSSEPMRAPTFSIVVPAYRSAQTIGATIESILAQDERDFELIVVDDGSADETPAIIEELSARDRRIRMISQENAGTAAARNTGWRAARAPLVAFLDDDDLWMPGYLSAVGAALAAHPDAGLAHADAYLYDESVGLIRRRTSFEHYEPIPEFIPAPALLERLVAENFVLSPVTVRTAILHELGGFDPHLRGTDDWDLWLRIAAAGFGSTHPAEPMIVQRDRPDSQSKDEALMFRGSVEVLEKLLDGSELSPKAAELARAQAESWRERVGQIERDAPIERARRARRRLLAVRDSRRGTWLAEPPAAVAAALPEIAAAYGRPRSAGG